MIYSVICMRKDEIMEILQDWNFWKKELDTGRYRPDYIDKCRNFLKTNVIIAIIGVRRSGKSYIMRQLMNKISENTEKKNILMINFEDRRFAEFYSKILDEIYDAYLEFLKPDKNVFVFLDEIHNVPKWEKWVRTMHELGKAKIIISGSSSKLLSGELSSVLTGRHLDVHVIPLSFKEFLQFKNIEVKDKLDTISKRLEIKRALNEYMEFGGFPEVVLGSEKKQLLLTYFDDILTKDIERRYKLKKSDILRSLAKFYLTNTSGTITFNSLKKSLDTTTNTIEKFSSYLEESNILFFVKRFSFKVKEQEKAARKVYAIDVGLSNAVGFKFISNFGRIMENIVAIELKKAESLNPNMGIFYWQNQQQYEVDFVVKEGLKVKKLIQACWDISGYKTKEREIRALTKAGEELKCKNLIVITEDYEAEETINGKKIKFIPLWKWLLDTLFY